MAVAPQERGRFNRSGLTLILATVLALLSSAADADDRRFFERFTFDEAIPTPEAALGYAVGDHFTRHADQLAYLRTLAAVSDRVRYESYGQSVQRRELAILTISSPANLQRLEDILADNRRLTDPSTSDADARAIIERNPAITWFSYGVHGNEPSPSECAIQMAYTLAAATDASIRTILDNVIVVIDPMLNPDGHERYVAWFQNALGATPNPSPDAVEHHEPWPGGRTNHYCFDLNRDWLWLVQPESPARLRIYRRYLPHLHIDHHEQGHQSPFFFGAGDEPYHAHIPAETRAWIERYGRANASAFDGEGLVYSTAERFDYLYPGYGKVMPVYHGAIGMLAEKGGHARAGLAIDVRGTYTLTLGERTAHHFLLGISNLELTSQEREGQLRRFRSFFDPREFVASLGLGAVAIDPNNDPALLAEVWRLCAAHGIDIEVLDQHAKVEGWRDYRRGTASDQPILLEAGSWIIRTDQPMGRLVATLFERHTVVSDRDTYDITAWSLPVAFGLRAHYSTRRVTLDTSPLAAWSAPPARVTGAGDVAMIVDAKQHRFPLAIGAAARHDIAARVAGADFTLDGRRFTAGSLIVFGVRNAPEKLDALAADITAVGLNVHRTGGGLTDEGPVLGANANSHLVAPRILLLGGSGTSSYSYGQLWHLLDVAAPLPHTVVHTRMLDRLDLSAYNVLVVPAIRGSLTGALGEQTVKAIDDWVRAGGTIVALDSGAAWVQRSLLDLEPATRPGNSAGAARPADNELSYDQRRQRRVEDRVPGSLLAADVDRTHPLAAGAGSWVGVIKRSSRTLSLRSNGYAVARFGDEPVIGGVISQAARDRVAGTPMMTDHRHGRGRAILFSEDVTFRGFQHGSMRLLLNAVTLGPSGT